MASAKKTLLVMRTGDTLQIGREKVSFGRNIIARTGPSFMLQHRLFVNDPWELIAEEIHRSVPDDAIRDIAHSFRRQAEDYFRAATVGREFAVRPVLLYYAFLNLSKAYGIAKGNVSLAQRAYHGISSVPKPRAIPGSLVRFEGSRRPAVFQELLQQLNGSPAVLGSDLKLGHLLPQILPGHRLWCYTTKPNRPERFLTVESFDVLHSPATREVWLNLYLDRNDLDRFGITQATVLSRADLAGEFEIATGGLNRDWVCIQQRTPTRYVTDPGEALAEIVAQMRNKVWETVRITSPYRKSYVYLCPVDERRARLPQMLAVYLLMYFLSSVTRSSPGADFQ